jgi:hypothetical protein
MSPAPWRRRPAGTGDRRDAAVPPAPGGSGPGSGAGGGTPEERRFAQAYAEDRVGPMPYPHQVEPDVATARGRVRALVNDLLPGGVDEGTGAALDPLIASWASGWLARVDSEHADHHAVIDRLVGGARRQLADAEATHEQDRRALEIARGDHADARERLMDLEAPAGDDPASGRRGPLRRRRPAAPERAPEPATGPMRIPPGSYGTTVPAGSPPGLPTPRAAGPDDEEAVTDQPLGGRDVGSGVPLGEEAR